MAENKRYLDPKTIVAYYTTPEEREGAMKRLKERGCARIEDEKVWRLNEQELCSCLIGYVESSDSQR